MKLIDLPTLAKRRFASDDPKRTLRWLQALARREQLPGGRKMGGRWMCDLEAFDAPKEPAANDQPPPESLAQMIARARRAGASG